MVPVPHGCEVLGQSKENFDICEGLSRVGKG